MKKQKKLVALGMSLLIVGGALTTASAYVYKTGDRYQTVTIKDIPGWGNVKYDEYYGSKKITTGPFATFKKTHGDAALGNFAELVTRSHSPRSMSVGIPKDISKVAEEHLCKKNEVYFSAAISSSVEPSNTCDVTMQFSADDLKH